MRGGRLSRITYFPDRPDVLSRYSVRLVADKARYPVLLANGDPVESGDLGDGRHWAEWNDPFPNPVICSRSSQGIWRSIAAASSRNRVARSHRHLGPRRRYRQDTSCAPCAEAVDGVGRARLWPRIRPRCVQHRGGRRFQLRRDGEQGAEHLQQPLHPRRSRHGHRLRL